MNNGKVRIYELSRELNLDNKDILAVCDRLNIPVKSHSSTITESEAERIRKTAEKYVASPSSSGKSAPAERAVPPSRESGPRSNDPKKQQILEIRRPKVRSGVNPKQSGSEDTTSSQQSPVATPPKQSVAQQSQPTAKPILNRPLPSNPGATPPSMVESEPVGEDLSEATHFEPEPEPQPPQVVQPTPKPMQSVAASAKLVNPPVRPAAGSPNRPPSNQPSNQPSTSNQGSSNRPVLKTAKSELAPTESPRTSEPPSKPVKPQKGQPVSADGSETPKPRREITTPGKPGAGQDLKRPQPGTRKTATAAAPLQSPRRPQDVAATGEETEEREEEPLVEEISLLNRPTLPRPAKKAQVWDDEEEENPEAAGKAAKAGKAKRARIKPVLDDEEDFDEDLDIPAPVIVSLSLARPAKPKVPGQAKAATVGATVGAASKNKKPALRDATTTTTTRGRRPVETKTERPEILIVNGPMTVQELAVALIVPETEIIRRLFTRGLAVNITETLDMNAIEIIAEELGVLVETAQQQEEARKPDDMLSAADLENLHRRPPVVTIMGHVDHGKTTLLDSIRNTKVAQGEAGGITQHIGAYHVDVEHEGNTQQVVFLDTPGHEAFTAMRARGARVTDIAILVVAADDGVQPQTIEAISHAKAAGVPIVVAINKIDKEDAQPDRVKQELTEFGLVPEEWGGETIMVPVSAIKGENLDTLLEMILLVAEVEDLSANPDRAAKGTVIEAHLDKARGPVATLLVQNGTLRVGDIVVAGSALGKVRAMIDDRSKRVDAASPSFAVEVLGLRDVPKAGDEFEIFQNEKEAAAIASARAQSQRESRLLQGGRISLSGFSQQAKEGELKELNLILKADVQGSVEAIVGALRQLPQKEVQLRLLLAAPGEITETDIDLAAASAAVIIGFNTTLASGARQAADAAGVDVREYNIIYNLLDDVQGAMEGLLEPELVEEPLGQVEVRAVFPISRGAVAGCYVLNGKVIRNCKVRVRRGNQVIYEGVLDSLKRMKEDAKEVNAGYECGIALNNFSDWSEGDIIEAYRMVTKRRTLSQ